MRPPVRLCLSCPSLQSKARANKWSTYIMLWRQRRGQRWCVSLCVPCRFTCLFVCKCQVMVAAVLVTLELKAKCASSPTVFVPAVAAVFLSPCSPPALLSPSHDCPRLSLATIKTETITFVDLIRRSFVMRSGRNERHQLPCYAAIVYLSGYEMGAVCYSLLWLE